MLIQSLIRQKLGCTLVALSIVCLLTRAEAQNSPQICPVHIDQVQLSYNHQGGQSKPQLTSKFSNNTKQQIVAATFSLLLLDSNGTPRPYPDDLTYSDKLEPGQKKVFTWDLLVDSIDMHRTGESLILEKVEFADNSSWRDDGSESCVYTIDFHAKY